MAKKVKTEEDAVKASLVSEMDVQKIPSVKFAGIGRFVLRNSVRYEITDIELFMRATMNRLMDNASNSKPLSDGFMFQKRAAKTVIEELSVDEQWNTTEGLAMKGLSMVESLDVTFTRDKGANNE